MIVPEICDLTISGYLSNPLFKRFNKILINTICTNFTDNAQQLFARKFPSGKTKKIANEWMNLGFKTPELAKQFHKAAYNSWERNLHALQPEKIFFTKVNTSGDLLTNNIIICRDWRGKANLNY